MGIRENFQKLIDKKVQEIRDLELKVKEAQAYVQALQDSMKFLPRNGDSGPAEHSLRAGSQLAKARDLIKAAGTPLPIADILKGLNKPQDKKHRVSLGSTLAGYARQGRIFTKTAPNTFGLVELGVPKVEADDLPEEFGSMQS
jgi:hypothetical protein